jgi:hypothetical protein
VPPWCSTCHVSSRSIFNLVQNWFLNSVIGFISPIRLSRIGQLGQAIQTSPTQSTRPTRLDPAHIILGQPYSIVHGLWSNLDPCNQPNLAYKALIQVQNQHFGPSCPHQPPASTTTYHRLPNSGYLSDDQKKSLSFFQTQAYTLSLRGDVKKSLGSKLFNSIQRVRTEHCRLLLRHPPPLATQLRLHLQQLFRHKQLF